MLSRRAFLKATAGAAASALGIGVYAWRVEPHWVTVTHRRMPIENLPAGLAGKRLVQISDLHVGPVVDGSYLYSTLEMVNGLAPDILVITGDHVTWRGPAQLGQLRWVLGALGPGRLGSFAIPGNHDYGPRWQDRAVCDEIGGVLGERGIRLLRNEVAEVGGLQIAGVDDLWGPQFHPSRTIPQVDLSRAAIALCHNPDGVDRGGWGEFRGWILAGHTHGGQVKPPFMAPPRLPIANRRYAAGEVALRDGRRLYVNRGLGHLARVRFNVRPEVTVFRLEAARRQDGKTAREHDDT